MRNPLPTDLRHTHKIYSKLRGKLITAILVAIFSVTLTISLYKKAFPGWGFGHYCLTILGEFAILLLAFYAIHFVSVKMDKKYTWKQRPFIRTILQIVLGYIILSIAGYYLSILYFFVRGIDKAQGPYFNYDYVLLSTTMVFFSLFYYELDRWWREPVESYSDPQNN